MIGAGLEGVAGSHDPALVAGGGARGPNPRGDDGERISKASAQKRNFQGTADDAAKPDFRAQSDEVFDLFGRGAGDADLMESGFIHAGQNGDAEDDEGAMLGGPDGFFYHAAAAGEMDGRHVHPQGDGGVDRFAGGIRDVVEFKVEKDFASLVLHLSDDGGTFGRKKLESDFDPSDGVSEGFHQPQGGEGVGRVDGDDDFFFSRNAHRLRMREP